MLRIAPARGPDQAPASKPGVGLLSTHSFSYAVGVGEEVIGSLWRAPVEVPGVTDALIVPGTSISYAVFPAFRAGAAAGEGFEATAVAIDLEFDDGSWLSGHPVEDEAGYGPSAAQRFDSRSVTPDQWNRRTFPLDAVAGRRVAGVWVVAEAVGAAPYSVHGWISDIAIEAVRPQADRLTDLVDTRRGSHSSGEASRGNTVPAVARPHGFNLGIPVTDAASFEWQYQYHAGNGPDNRPALQALAVSHTPSPWIGDRGMVQLMPMADVSLSDATGPRRARPFRHADETARAHYYAVELGDGVAAEMTATDHVVIMRLTLPRGGGVLLDQPDDRGSLVFDAADRLAPVTGYTDSKTDRVPSNSSRMYFAIAFDQPLAAVRRAAVAERPRVSAMLEFEFESASNEVVARIATSFIGVDQALAALGQEAPASAGFDDLVDDARECWQDQLSVLTIDGGSEAQRIDFVSSLYRLFLYPSHAGENIGTAHEPRWAYADVAGSAPRAHGERHTGCEVRPGRSFVNNGFWDTYRTAWPAYFLLEPDRASVMLDGFVEHFRAAGWIERWSAPGATDCMVGTSSDIVIADAVASGVELADWEAAYDSALRNATTVSDRTEVGRAANHRAVFCGYVSTAVHEGLSWSLESALNDFGISRLSAALLERLPGGHARRVEIAANERYFGNRARNYRRLFQPESGFFVGRDDDGSARVEAGGYDPAVWGGDYTETNGWGMAFSVPHDGAGLSDLHGGRAGLEAKLDEFFATPESGAAAIAGSYGRVIHEMTEARDVRLGMLGLSNQPAHHIPFLYAFTDAPHKTQAIVRECIRRLFLGSDIGQGYPGDEDNGEMSAWYLFASIGLYPLTPASGEYLITAPAVERSVIRLPDGRQTSILARGLSPSATFIRSVTVDGQPWEKASIPVALVRTGVEIVIDLVSTPVSRAVEPHDAPFSHSLSASLPPLLLDRTARVEDSPFDDDSSTGVVLEPGESIEHEFPVPAVLDLYTVTLGDPVSCASWVIEAADADGVWRVVDERLDQRFRWPQQTRAFEAAAEGAFARVRLTVAGSEALDLRQLEFLG
ncbi:GH92 family glycosyl hydrolase [Herbiconiux sp. 11R-BC]|uniref:GH92 family glycosyl hydrolase n=1 Tax=Herbiconiux sp. 11R-BC TaxID=3111637 RepID=UPI003C1279DF